VVGSLLAPSRTMMPRRPSIACQFRIINTHAMLGRMRRCLTTFRPVVGSPGSC
jgi:hypothetical protein